ncbi:MAG: ATPase [Sphingomonas fennica]
MPQIAQLASTYAGQVFWMLVVFALIYFGIGRGMVPKIESVVDSRDRRISGDLAAAERARAAADETEAAYRARMDQARSLAQDETGRAKADAARASEARLAAAGQGIAARTADAEARIAAAREQALASLDRVAAEAAQDIVSRVAGISVTTDEAAAAVSRVAA